MKKADIVLNLTVYLVKVEPELEQGLSDSTDQTFDQSGPLSQNESS